jgi:hypothetical protein
MLRLQGFSVSWAYGWALKVRAEVSELPRATAHGIGRLVDEAEPEAGCRIGRRSAPAPDRSLPAAPAFTRKRQQREPEAGRAPRQHQNRSDYPAGVPLGRAVLT